MNNQIEHPIRSRHLVLMWRAPESSNAHRHFPVGDLRVVGNSDEAEFAYRSASELEEARKLGFEGHPAYALEADARFANALSVLARRLPPATRGDYGAYLATYALPATMRPTQFDLLALTQGIVPGDPYYFVDTLESACPPIDFLMQVNGTRHYSDNVRHVEKGQAVRFVPEPSNPYDPYAVRVDALGQPIGYVPRVQAPQLGTWIGTGDCLLQAHVFRKNGTAANPRIVLFVQMRDGKRQAAE